MSPSSSHGGSQPVYESGYYAQSGSTNIPDGGNALLPWNDFAAGDDVLDISDPTKPTVRKAGLFTFCVEVGASPFTPGGAISLSLTLDFTGEAIEIRNSTLADTSAGPCEIVGSWALAEGEQIRLRASNFDGVQDRNFNINNATVSRVGPA